VAVTTPVEVDAVSGSSTCPDATYAVADAVAE
jgi:hypothetical protein